VAAVSLGSAATLPARIGALQRRYGLVIADLPGGAAGLAALGAIVRERPAGTLVIALQRTAAPGGELLWSAAAGLAGGGAGELTSASTNERGLISAADVAPTVLRCLGVSAMPAGVNGRPITAQGRLDAAALRGVMARLRVILDRRLPALALLAVAWALLLAAAWPLGAGARARALRVGALAALWAPAASLIGAALQPPAAVEYATFVLACVALGAISDALIAWPRAALAPALAAVIALSVDALTHSQLLMRSLFGPDPIGGARFYGIGNELKSVLAVIVLAGVAGALYPARRGRRAVAAMAAAGVVLAFVEGSARIGAGVGGAIIVSGGFAVACVMLLPGALSRRRALTVLATPPLALLALAAVDLASAHGSGHFSASILHARSAGEVRDLIVRRYTVAGRDMLEAPMLIASALALGCAAAGVIGRRELLAPVQGDRGFSAAFAGGLAAGVLGALVEDSGALPLIVAVGTLACVAGYLRGRPPPVPRRLSPRGSRGRRRGARSRALRPPAAHAS